jgi:hypothetical protein
MWIIGESILAGKPKYLENNMYHCYFVYYKSYMDHLGLRQDLHGERPEISCLSHGTALKLV